MPQPGRTPELAHTIGKPWWLDDPDPTERDASTARFVGQGRFACIMALYAVLAALALKFAPPVWTTTAADVARSSVLPAEWLGAFRATGALLVLAVVLSLMLGPPKCQSETTLDGRELFLRIGGAWQLGGLTQTGWVLIGLYLAVSSYVTWTVWASPDDEAHKTPSSLACGLSSLLGVAFGFSLLITMVVTFLLVPLEHSAGHSVAGYFGRNDLIMHNANVGLMTLEVLLGSLSIDMRDLAFVVLFGCSYLVWHQFIRYRYTRTLIYSFLSWQSPHAFKVATALVAALCSGFLLGRLITEYVRPAQPWGPPIVLLAAFAIMRFRPPRGPPGKKAKPKTG